MKKLSNVDIKLNYANSTTKRLESDIVAINKLIDEYNDNIDNLSSNFSNAKDVRFENLSQIRQEIQAVSDNYPLDYLGTSEVTGELYNKLFLEIKEAYQDLGINSLLNSKSPPHSVEEIIANMSPKKLEYFLRLLINKQDPAKLYKKDSKEGENFQNFLNTHSIQSLGGNNSINFIITPTNPPGGKNTILKLDLRRTLPKESKNKAKSTEVKLRNISSLSKVFIPIQVERQVKVEDYNSVSRTLYVIEQCTGGDLLNERSNTSHEDLIDKTCTLYDEMAGIFGLMSDNNSFFADAKNTNWLLDDKGHLHISDAKSIEPTTNKKKVKNEHIIIDGCINVPERTIYSDKAHSYILGKNLYQFLTDCSDKNLSNMESNAPEPIFNSGQGQEL